MRPQCPDLNRPPTQRLQGPPAPPISAALADGCSWPAPHIPGADRQGQIEMRHGRSANHHPICRIFRKVQLMAAGFLEGLRDALLGNTYRQEIGPLSRWLLTHTGRSKLIIALRPKLPPIRALSPHAACIQASCRRGPEDEIAKPLALFQDWELREKIGVRKRVDHLPSPRAAPW